MADRSSVNLLYFVGLPQDPSVAWTSSKHNEKQAPVLHQATCCAIRSLLYCWLGQSPAPFGCSTRAIEINNNFSAGANDNF